MKIISNLASKPTSNEDGKPAPKFGALAGIRGKHLNKVFSGSGLLIYKHGVNSAVLIPESELDAIAIAHEPLFAPSQPNPTSPKT